MYNGLTTVFIVFIGEDWNSVMYDHYRATGPLTIAYFMFLFIFGNLILLNLFLAILLKNFEEPPGVGAVEEVEEKTIKKVSLGKRVKNWCTSCCFKTKLKNIDEIGSGNAETEMVKQEKKDEVEVDHEKEFDSVSASASQIEESGEQMIKDKDGDEDEDEEKKYKKMEFSISMIKLSEVKKSQGPKIKEIELTGSSMMFLNHDNKFRMFCAKIVGHSNFDNLVIMLILVSTILLAIENPFEDPLS